MRFAPLFLCLLAACGGGGDLALLVVDFRILSPSGDGAANEANPLVTWTAASGASRYELSVYTDAALTDMIDQQEVADTAARITPALADGQVVFVRVRAIGPDALTPVVRFQVVLVPDGFPTFELLVDDPARAQGGYKLFNLHDVFAPRADERIPALVIVNAAGEIVWWYVHGQSGLLSDPRLLPNGNFMFYVRWTDAAGDVQSPAFEMAWDGTIVWQSRPGVQVHHECAPGPDGNYLYLTWIAEVHDGTSYEGDGIELVDPATNQVLWEWSIFDHFDPADFQVPEIANQGLSGTGVDWSHSNSATWDEARSLIWVSIRHFDRIIGVDYPSGAIRATIGGDGSISHQHAPEVQADGQILFFDNGNRKPVEETRVVIVRVDEAAGTVEETFSWKDDPPFYDVAVGDADRQPNGNILITSGINRNLIEITPAGEKVWQLRMVSNRMFIYRTQQIDEALIPPGALPFR